jgi:iron complex transport system permease protein
MGRKKLQTEKFFENKRKTKYYIFMLFIFTIVLSLISMFTGRYGMRLFDTINSVIGIKKGIEADNIRKIIFNIRMPRTIASVVIGGILAISGLTYQCVFRNTLVSQDILGVSTSACVGAALGIIMGLSTIYIQVLAFTMGVLSICLVFVLSSKINLDKTLSLILSGILIGGVMSSLLALIKYLANPERHLQAIVFWTMGDISSISLEQLGYISLPVITCTVIIFAKRWDLNYFCFADSEVKTIGINIAKNRVIFIGCATVLVASAVSISGSIGWIGLVIPQLVRLLVGTNNNDTIPMSFLMGSSFLLIVDIINRLISAAELPVSIISGLIGLPVFVVCWFIKANNIKEIDI